jgi:uncharacterized membrane protein
VSFDDWLLALHVLSAFAVVAALTLFTILIVGMRKVDTVEETLLYAPVARVGTIAVGIGITGTLVFGIWLAIALDRYHVWDGWIIAAIILWALAAAVGGRSGSEYAKAGTRAKELRAAGQEGAPGELRALNASPAGLRLHTISTLLTLLILVDMIWKPGA